MVSASRRDVLHGALALGALLAGCADRETAPPPDPSDNDETVADDPASVMLRSTSDSIIVELPTPTASERSPGQNRPPHGEFSGLIASRERADRLSFADVDGADEARQFVDETDFTSETLGIEPSRVGECYRKELCYVLWSDSEYQPWFLETYRDADVACSEGEYDDHVTLFRLPATLDPETTERNGAGTSRTGCRDPPPVPRGEVDT